MTDTMTTRTLVLAVLIAGGVSIAQDAKATQTCGLGAVPSTTYSNPTVSYCALAAPVTNGSGVGLLAQDQSTTTISNTYAIEADSPNNIAIHAVAGGDGVWASSTSANGVYGTSASSGATGVYGINTGNGAGIAGVISPVGAGYAVYGSNNSSSGYAGWFIGSVDVWGPLYDGITCLADCTSDIRLKKNIQPLSGALDDILRLRPVTFEWKSPNQNQSAGTQTGFIAQEVEKVKPEWVSVNQDGFKTINLDPMRLDAMFVESFQTIRTENDDLRVRSALPEDRVKSLEAGRRPLVSGLRSKAGSALALCAIAGALVLTRRKRPEERA